MKNHILILTSILFLAVMFCSAVSAAGGTWHNETVSNDLGGMTSLSNSIAIDKSGNPHISYYDYMNQDLMYAKKTGNTWQRETVDSIGNIGAYNSLVLDENDNPHIAYKDNTNNNLKYAYKIGDNPWQTIIVENANCYDISLALDSQGNPFICYTDDASSLNMYRLLIQYAYKKGDDYWKIENVDQFTDFSYTTSITLDNQGNPYISYCDQYNNLVKYAFKMGDNSWQKYDIDTGSYPYLVLDNSGNPNVAYFNNGNLVYAVWDGNNWNKSIMDQASGYIYNLVIDASGNPYIGYEDWIYGGNYILMKYANKTSEGWSIKEYDRLEKGMGIIASMALNNSRNPHFSYIYYGTLTYTYFLPAQPPIVTVNPIGSHYNSVQTVTLTTVDPDSTATTYYTTDGSDPQTSLTRITYTNPIEISSNTLLIFCAVDPDGNWSDIYSQTYTIDTIAPTVTANPIGSTYNSAQTVTLTTVDLNSTAHAYYTIDGSDPTINGQTYNNPIEIATSTVLKYVAVDPAGNWSPIYTQNYIIDTIAPTASAVPVGGLYNTSKTVTLNISEAGTIYYTLNGTTPTTGSAKYTGPISISSTKTLKFLAVDLAGNKSPIDTQKYIIDKTAPKVSTSNPSSGKTGVKRNQTITVTFNENIKSGTNYSKIVLKSSSGKTITITKSISGKVLTIKHSSKLTAKTKYTLTLYSGCVKDMAGNPLAAKTITFTTGSS